MFIKNPPPSYVPKYRIGPFRTIDLSINTNLIFSSEIDNYFDNRFGSFNYSYHYRGRKAFYLALSQYNLQKDDEVAIITTSQNTYISGCVTVEIEKFCNWSREINEKTKIIFVNHEFGFPYEDLANLKQYGLPIIEDCAHSFYSESTNKTIGKIGDFVIYSFPKMFPLQIGGLLVSNCGIKFKKDDFLDKGELNYIKSVLSRYFPDKREVLKKRIHNYNLLMNKFSDLGFKPRFELQSGYVPGVFMFKVPDENIDLIKLRKHVEIHGIECSVFYGERAFFVPVHQNLNDFDIDYIYFTIQNFVNETEKNQLIGNDPQSA
ncbi:DegT/DnrJ/EryC1/StrS family aminotransferase [Namhaeicola litoreus]|uniref:DegT/DnrJ/EryC1/StrS family aminotransferase n=1 Tax=Namhaeicola litoreus TaxID=1052145 RepID=A0ABW3Y7W8_9FLAO